MRGSLMKERLCRLIYRNRPFFSAVLSFLCGILLFALLRHRLSQPGQLPIRSALSCASPVLALIADYAKEVELFLPMAVLSLWVLHPLFAYSYLCLRGVYAGFSSAALFLWDIPLFFSSVYLVLHVAVLVAYTAMVYCLISAIKEKRNARTALSLLFYAGIIFLLCIIRNLVYYLFLQ